jgi:hypothetical protein
MRLACAACLRGFVRFAVTLAYFLSTRIGGFRPDR